jgi:hypothetical protein
MAYDAEIGTLLLLDGQGASNGLLKDVWQWTDLGWGNRCATNSPAARDGAAMAYDPGTGTMLLFGGEGTNGPDNDTWAWGY